MSSCCCTLSSLQIGHRLRARGSRGSTSRRAGAGASARASQLCAAFEVQKSRSRRLQARWCGQTWHCPLLLAICCPLVLSCLVSYRGQLKGRQFRDNARIWTGDVHYATPTCLFSFCIAAEHFRVGALGLVGRACPCGMPSKCAHAVLLQRLLFGRGLQHL